MQAHYPLCGQARQMGERQYLYLAVIDSRPGKLLSKQEQSAQELLGLDAKTILKTILMGWWSWGGAPRTTNSITDIANLHNRTGSVDVPRYLDWLRQNGYTFARPN